MFEFLKVLITWIKVYQYQYEINKWSTTTDVGIEEKYGEFLKELLGE